MGIKNFKFDENVQKAIIKDYSDNVPIKEITKKYNCSDNCVYNYIKKYNVPLRDNTQLAYTIGDKVGNWTLLSFFYRKNEIYWKCVCSCGNSSSVRQSALKKNRSLKCKSCAGKESTKKFSIGVDEKGTTLVIRSYRNSAKSRNLEFSLTRDDFYKLIHQDCHYCGEPPSNSLYVKKKNDYFLYNGIDRIDNSEGYTIENCVPCCAHCNYAKREFSQEQFLNWVKKIYLYQFKRVTDKTPAIVIDELFTVNMKLWYEQEKIMNCPKDSSEALEAAKKAQELNAKRNRNIRALDQLLDFEEASLTYKTYDVHNI